MSEDDYAMAVEAIHRFMDIAADRDAVLDDLSNRILDRLEMLKRTETGGE